MVDWVFINLVTPIALAVIGFLATRYALRNWATSWIAGSIALGAAVLAWLMSWFTWWEDVWSYLLFDNFFRTMAVLIPLSAWGIAVLIRRRGDVIWGWLTS